MRAWMVVCLAVTTAVSIIGVGFGGNPVRLLVPVLIAAVPLLFDSTRAAGIVALISSILLMGCVILGVFSIGWFYFPGVLAMLMASRTKAAAFVTLLLSLALITVQVLAFSLVLWPYVLSTVLTLLVLVAKTRSRPRLWWVSS